MPERQGYWLPEDYVLKLNAYELGWLRAAVAGVGDGKVGHDIAVNVQGPEGEIVPTTMTAALGAKMDKLVGEASR